MTTSDIDPIEEIEDHTGDEIYKAQYQENRTLRWGTGVLTLLLLGAGGTIAKLALRPPIVLTVRINEAGVATPIAYNTFNYTPQDVELRNYLTNWANYRYRHLRATTAKEYPANYHFVEDGLASQLMAQDRMTREVPKILTGQMEENEIEVRNVQFTGKGQERINGMLLPTGSAVIDLYKTFLPKPGSPTRKEHWAVSVNFYLNYEQVWEKAKKNPEYQNYNPLGLTLTYIHPDRAID